MLKVANSVINVSQITGVLPVVNGGTGVTTSTGTGNTVLSASPTLSGTVTLSTGSLIFSAAGQGITGSSAFSVSIANAGTGTLLDLSLAMPAGSTGIVNVAGASAGKATILCQRDQGGYYSVTELGTQPRGTYITSITLSGTNLRITNATGGTETFSGHIIIMI